MERNPTSPLNPSGTSGSIETGSSIQASSESTSIQIPTISLPKGGGALKGIDEKFQVNPANGTASFSIPLPITPGRGGFSPTLSLSYNSGSGNGPFGLGWSLGYASIVRKTDKEIPKYKDGPKEDVFTLSGLEDLVPMLVEDVSGNWQPDLKVVGPYSVKSYRPRIETEFSRIEKIKHPDKGIFWKVTTRDNVVTFFGRSPEARISNPTNPDQIFRWLPEVSFDDKGNFMRFIYKEENLGNVPETLYERNRLNGLAPFTNQYLKRIRYGNHRPYQADASEPFGFTDPLTEDYYFELVLDYGEHHPNLPSPEEVPGQLWPYRPDAFSTYRSGFEIKTNRLCERVLMFHHFPDEQQPDGMAFGANYLVKSIDLFYQPSDINDSGETEVSYLNKVTKIGYIRNPDGSYRSKIVPPMEFFYQRLQWNNEIKKIPRENIINAPAGLTNNYNWVDLYGEGISGILTEQAEALYYSSNLGNINDSGILEFTVAKPVAPKPSYSGFNSGLVSLQDLASSGEKQVVVEGYATRGYFELGEEKAWKSFKSFGAQINIDPLDPQLRRLDLTGDGKSELVITDESAFIWYQSEGKEGYSAALRTVKAIDEEKGPAIVFADSEQTVFLADMCGDGLTDILRIRNGEVCYWANLGYGNFSAKITMGNAPTFDHPDAFNTRYLHLADVSGTGATDILYLGKNSFQAFLNLSGNALSNAHEITPFFPIDSHANLSVIDLLGTGTSCIVWSSDLLSHERAPMQYIDLMHSKKPHILVNYVNNTGKETRLEYKSSTHFYLQDKQNNKPWVTKLPFPVQVLVSSQSTDKISGSKFISKYAYHHGCYDHEEREFRGFGMVEQWDTENYEAFKEGYEFPSGAETDETSHIAPIHTKSWFHTGLYLQNERISKKYQSEYYQNLALPQLRHIVLPKGLTTAEIQEAHRALKGALLHQEIYADDETTMQSIPYLISQVRAHIVRCQPMVNSRHAVFYVYQCESLSIQIERNPHDPRIAHNHTLEIDKYGNPLQSISIVYPRKIPEFAEQGQTQMILTISDFTNVASEDNWLRLGIPNQVKTYEVTGLPASSGPLYSKDEINNQLPLLSEIQYEVKPSGSLQKRMMEHSRILYSSNDQTSVLPLGTVESLALPYKTYTLSFNQGILTNVYGSKVSPVLLNNAGYETAAVVFGEAATDWWKATAHQLFDAANFYLPLEYIDPFGNSTKIFYDTPKLMITGIEDPLGNTPEAKNDYRVLQPWQFKDINENISEVVFDALGMTKVASASGAVEGQQKGDARLGTYSSREPVDFSDLLNNPHDFLQGATIYYHYDLLAYMNDQKPVRFLSITRETHQSELAPGAQSPVQFQVGYSDGYGRELLSKVPAENGLAPRRTVDMELVLVEGAIEMEFTTDRWVGTGRVIYNNKGNPIKQYEPYFDSTHDYNEEDELRSFGVTPYLHYDALGRLVRTDMPDGTFTKIEFDSWQQRAYDQNDTVQESDWFLAHGGIIPQLNDVVPNDTEARLGFLAAIHYNTPVIEYLDVLGRPFLTRSLNRSIEMDNLGRITNFPETQVNTRILLDLEGLPLKFIDALNPEVTAFSYPDNPLPKREVIHYTYAIDGQQLYHKSMDSGARWALFDVAGKPVFQWDAKQNVTRMLYDVLQRPTQIYVKHAATEEKLVEYSLYGENVAGDIAKNLNGQLKNHFDSSGMLKNELVDFKGNVLRTSRSLISQYKNPS